MNRPKWPTINNLKSIIYSWHALKTRTIINWELFEFPSTKWSNNYFYISFTSTITSTTSHLTFISTAISTAISTTISVTLEIQSISWKLNFYCVYFVLTNTHSILISQLKISCLSTDDCCLILAIN